jgi:AraC-like DNA-binding protein
MAIKQLMSQIQSFTNQNPMLLDRPIEFVEPEIIQPLVIMLLEKLNDAALLVDHNGNFIYGNLAAIKLLNCSTEDLQAMAVCDLPLTSFLQVWLAQWSDTSGRSTIRFLDKYFTQADGELPVEITFTYEQDIDREYSCLLIHKLEPEQVVDVPAEYFVFPKNPQLERVFQFIEDNYSRSISLKDVAMAMGYCPSYLTDLVRRHTGQTVNHWIIKRRIALACNLLEETSLSVNQIALDVGYQNEGHFFRQFRQHCNMPPSAWRKSQQRRLVS